MAQTRLRESTAIRIRQRPIRQRLILVAIALAIVFLALGGWAAQWLRNAW
jgi:uncharacterized membrane protein YcjF (UPF0283 family)